ncbi:uncharacterized protein FFB20_12236 [Fusarium fujikuroi]|nr:Uncharacterized protein Y057_2616 [Fusarium fujikuroi]SCN92410.1 uncharacterized protein FFC1_06737 [Fusarium fujikuroi]SCO04965.1 uncharacterized protein FFB20_12236 [Fusarium fujikuroi]VTT79181.1 unnamed protein product [Fusarium fujikuroi]VZH98941.1 unnamed protein product [Fusarium fujikuroi]
MASTLVALILGAGPRVGAGVAREFSKIGYKVALVSKSGSDSTTSEGYLSLKADLADLNTAPGIFQRVYNEWKASPSVVIWNAGARTVPPVDDDMFSLAQESLVQDININALGPYVAAQQAVDGWRTLAEGAKKTFIYTGNKMNIQPLSLPATATLGMGKSASSYWISLADNLYQGKGARFFYADQRQADGNMGGMGLDGDAHGQFFVQLAQHEKDIPWLATFVPGTGYVKF